MLGKEVGLWFALWSVMQPGVGYTAGSPVDALSLSVQMEMLTSTSRGRWGQCMGEAECPGKALLPPSHNLPWLVLWHQMFFTLGLLNVRHTLFYGTKRYNQVTTIPMFLPQAGANF